jgi:hypothetical protein
MIVFIFISCLQSGVNGLRLTSRRPPHFESGRWSSRRRRVQLLAVESGKLLHPRVRACLGARAPTQAAMTSSVFGGGGTSDLGRAALGSSTGPGDFGRKTFGQ